MKYSSPVTLAILFFIGLTTTMINVARARGFSRINHANGLLNSMEQQQEELVVRMSPQEYLEKFLATGGGEHDIPSSIDWRRIPGRVGKVHDQGKECRAGWAFAAVGALEGQEYKSKSFAIPFGEFYKNNNQTLEQDEHDLVELSVQNLLDCDTFNYDGCNHGLVSKAFNFIAIQGGIHDADSYPYQGMVDVCRFKRNKALMRQVKGALVLPEGDEEKLKQVVANFGPVAAHMHTAEPAFDNYRSGVFKSSYCGNEMKNLDDGVLIVGYGIDPREGDFWLIKASRGTSWGMQGYMKLARNSNNMCGIATHAAIPIV